MRWCFCGFLFVFFFFFLLTVFSIVLIPVLILNIGGNISNIMLTQDNARVLKWYWLKRQRQIQSLGLSDWLFYCLFFHDSLLTFGLSREWRKSILVLGLFNVSKTEGEQWNLNISLILPQLWLFMSNSQTSGLGQRTIHQIFILLKGALQQVLEDRSYKKSIDCHQLVRPCHSTIIQLVQLVPFYSISLRNTLLKKRKFSKFSVFVSQIKI